MNTANLQLEGLLMAIAGINRLLVSKGMLTQEEIDLALRQAEASLSSERFNELSPANRDAIAFPVRLLLLANQSHAGEEAPEFGILARTVGETKKPYNDQT